MRLVLAAVLLVQLGAIARADRYEATISVRPTAALARLDESGAPSSAMTRGGGVTGGLSWGLRNWLDVGAELSAVALGKAHFGRVTAPVAGNPQTGELFRTTRLTYLAVSATLRLGVRWIPTVHAGVGVGARQRLDARLVSEDAGGLTVLIPDGQAASIDLDALATIRIGLDHRLGRRFTISSSLGITHYLGPGTPSATVASAGLGLLYSWYPLW